MSRNGGESVFPQNLHLRGILGEVNQFIRVSGQTIAIPDIARTGRIKDLENEKRGPVETGPRDI